MATRPAPKDQRRQQRLRHAAELGRAQQARRLRNRILIGVAGAIAALAAIFAATSLGGSAPAGGGSAASAASAYAYQVGQPGPGRVAPAIDLPSTSGGTFNLSAQRGKTVLLYFQEGLTCQPCWNQLMALDSHLPQLRALGISQLVSVTTDPLDALRSKVADEGITTPVLSDPNLAVSRAYNANQYGMMGTSYDGHSFIAVGPNGVIRWRADYGGAPNYTMYVPVPDLLAALHKRLDAHTAGQP